MAAKLTEIQPQMGAGGPAGGPGFSQQQTMNLGRSKMPAPPSAGRGGGGGPKLSAGARQGALGRLAQVLAQIPGSNAPRGPAGQTAPPGRGHGRNLFI